MNLKSTRAATFGAIALASACAFSSGASAQSTGYWGSGAATATAAGMGDDKDCDDEVARRQDMLRMQVVDDAVELAKANYESPLAGLGGFARGSCLDRLLNPGLDGMFSPPNLADILAMLEGFICNQASQMLAQATQPLTQSVYRSLPVGEIIPGVNLGSLSGGVGVRVNQGGGAYSGSYVNTNLSQVWARGQTGYGAWGSPTPTLFRGGLLDMRPR